MDEKKSYKSWTISDEFWEKVKAAQYGNQVTRLQNRLS